MKRSFDPNDLVMLPRTSALSALGLLRATLSAAAAAGKLPAPIDEAVGDIQVQFDNLSEKVRGRQTTTPESIVRELDIKLDAGWAGLHSFLSGFTRLPADFVESTKAASVLDRVYPDGLKFTQTPYSVEWGESESKLQTIKEEKLESVIVELGGRPFLAAIRTAHDNYGQALGITAASAAAQEQNTSQVREALEEAMAAMRVFVVRVSANVRRGDAKSEQLARTLLAPVSTWKSAASTGRSEETAAPPDPENQ